MSDVTREHQRRGRFEYLVLELLWMILKALHRQYGAGREDRVRIVGGAAAEYMQNYHNDGEGGASYLESFKL